MNTIKIKFDPFQNQCTISLNGEALARNDSLNNYVKKPLLTVAPKLLKEIGEELNDQYRITVVGTDFERYFLDALRKMEAYEACEGIDTENYGTEVDLAERFRQASAFVKSDTDSYKETVYSQIPLQLDGQLAKAEEDVEQASICVAADKTAAEGLEKICGGLLIFYPAQEEGITIPKGSKKYLWGVEEEQLQSRLQAVLERFAIPRFIALAESAAKEQGSADNEKTVETLKKIDIAVYASVANSAFEGDVLKPVFSSNIEGAALPPIRIESTSPQIVSVTEEGLKAERPGTAVVNFYKDNEIDPFHTATITVRPNDLLTQIRLTAPAEMKPGRKYQISGSYHPVDSPEIGKLVWSAADPSIVAMEQEGSFRALKAGKTVITAQAERVHGDVAVEILPGMEQILLSEEKISLTIAAKKAITVSVLPAACPTDKIICKTTNPKVAVAEKNALGQWVVTGKGIVAKGVGTCQLVFMEEDGSCRAVCEVTVESTINKSNKESQYLPRTAIAMVAAFILQLLPKPVGAVGAVAAAVAAILLGILGTIKKPKEGAWETILIVVSAIILFVNTLTLIGS